MFKGFNFTTSGYMSENNEELLSAAFILNDDGSVTKKIISVPRYSIDMLNERICLQKESQPVSLYEMVNILYAFTLGQRDITPIYQNNFIDRPSKTFFSEKFQLSFTSENKNLVNSAAVFNYHHCNFWNKDIAVIEKVFREYRYIIGTLAVMLLEAIELYNLEDKIVENFKIENVENYNFNKTVAQTFIDNVKNAEDAIELLEGIIYLGCYKDHTSTNKDLKVTKIRRWLDENKKDIAKLLQFPLEVFTENNVKLLKELGRKRCKAIYVICDKEDKIVDILKNKKENDKIYQNEQEYVELIKHVSVEIDDEKMIQNFDD